MIVSELHERWRFSLLLAAIVATLVMEPLFSWEDHRSWAFDGLFTLVLLSALAAITKQKRHRVWIYSLGAVTLIGTWSCHVFPDSWFVTAIALHHLAAIAFLVFIVGATLSAALFSRTITLDNLFGTLAGYLLLGTAWALTYSLIEAVSPNSFVMGEQLPQHIEGRHVDLSIFVYYSFITLTTVGFGDITPVTRIARTLSWTEAVVGQFYIATLVAALISVVASRPLAEALPRRSRDAKS